jgi:phosphoribosylformylglycinamidine synthase
VGKSNNDIASSEYLHKFHGVEHSPVPHFSLDEEYALQQLIKSLIEQKLILSAHDVSEGGLIVTLLESCFNRNLGVRVAASDETIRKDGYWFGEAQSRVVVTVSRARVAEFLNALGNHPYEALGDVTNGTIEVEGSDWGVIQDWKNKYDNAIETIISANQLAILAN